MSHRMSYWLAVILLFVAAILRLTSFTTLPPGLHEQEIVDIRVTERIRTDGGIAVFYDLKPLGIPEGREGLYHTGLALTTSLIGNGLIGYRMLSLWVGLLALSLTFILAHRLYGPIAGVAAMALMTFGMWPILLSRTVGREALVPFIVSGLVLALARALPVYWRRRHVQTSTTAFTIFGLLAGFSFYIHPVSLLLVMGSMAFIVYMLWARERMSRRRLSYIGFALLVTIIIATPYMISSFRLPGLAGANRIFGDYNGLLRALGEGVAAILFLGDSNAAYNFPGRPLIDLVSGLLMIGGILIALRNWRKPRYALPLIMLAFLAPAAFLAAPKPSFPYYTALIPLIAIFFGLGVRVLLQNLKGRAHMLGWLGLTGLLIFNVVWLVNDLFVRWPQLEETQTLYHARIAELALYLDKTADDIPSVICQSTQTNDNATLSDAQLMRVMMNRKDAPLRFADCVNGLIFTEGGEQEQFVLLSPDIIEQMHPYLRNWLSLGTVIQDDQLPTGSVITFDKAEVLADTVGRFLTTAPFTYAPEALAEGETPEPLAPPIRFENNLTFLGYETENSAPQTYQQGDIVAVITYWRVDGPLPSDLQLFTHLLSDPISIAAQHDTISISPRFTRERDVFVQVSYLPLPESLPDGEYRISIGAARSNSGERLKVLEGDNLRGDRLFLYTITVQSNEPPNDTESES